MLKFIAPFRALFSLDSSLIAANPARFSEFLKRVGSEIGNPQSALAKKIHPSLVVDVNIPVETGEDEIGSRYVSLNACGSLYLAPRIFTLRFRPSEPDVLETVYARASLMADEVAGEPYSHTFFPEMDSLRIDLHDNTIAILSLEMRVEHPGAASEDSAWNRLDEWTTVLVHFLLAGLYKDYIYPVLAGMKDFSGISGCRFVQGLEDYAIFPDLIGSAETPRAGLESRFMLMWVNRTLCYSNDYPVNHWMRPLIKSQDTVRIREVEAHLNSGNSVVVMPPGMDGRALAQLWDIMLSVQYYYAAMDVVNINLIRYIGTTFNKQSSKNLRRLSREMEAIINRITILQVRYHDFSMELQGVPKKIFQVLQKEWDFAVLVNNVHKKLELCKSNINVLNQETNIRNQGRTEIVLTSLTGMGILNLFVELGTVAR
jgi:hypothetical protein